MYHLKYNETDGKFAIIESGKTISGNPYAAKIYASKFQKGGTS